MQLCEDKNFKLNPSKLNVVEEVEFWGENVIFIAPKSKSGTAFEALHKSKKDCQINCGMLSLNIPLMRKATARTVKFMWAEALEAEHTADSGQGYMF